ncbi:MAG: PhzF family phenazine biosynthesis protein [Candidatus Hodarchaeales archaeon]|jgi:trans-2,3-dihydro-3-hydroxyanthranilate isomerase
MKGLEFYIVDVFAEKKFGGNQLAVFMQAGSLSSTEMQQIAREINFSETTFILSNEKSNGGYNVRIFTPAEEIPFAGHPTLGTAYIINKFLGSNEVKEIILNLKVGKIPVSVDLNNPEMLWMSQIQPKFGPIINKSELTDVLSIKTDDIDNTFPIQEVSTGLSFIIVPITSLDAVKRCKINLDNYYKLIENRESKGILVFSTEAYKKDHDLNVRVFVDYYGVPEDPATGSGNGCLASYLVKQRILKRAKINIRVEQGYEIGRPSLLYLNADETNGKINIKVGGKVKLFAKGELL